MRRPAAIPAKRTLIGKNGETSGERVVPEETPIAFTFDRETYAVMMASPADLEDFAVGFSFTERIISRPDEIEELEIVELPKGIELRMSLAQARKERLAERARRLQGRQVADFAASKVSMRPSHPCRE